MFLQLIGVIDLKYYFFAPYYKLMTLIKSISGIRGTIGGKEDESLTPIDVVKYTTAYADVIASGANKKIVVGRDARLSGEMVNQLVCGTLISKGIEVIDLQIQNFEKVFWDPSKEL